MNFRTELHAVLLRNRPALARASKYQFALERRDPGKQGYHQAPMSGGRVSPFLF